MAVSSRENRDLQLHQAARAGDKKAARTLEARDLLKQADQRSMQLRDKAVSGDSAAMRKLKELAQGSSSAESDGVATGRILAAEESARKKTRAVERKRVEQVFASESSKGRERLAASLLTASDNWTAKAIISQLPNMPTDAEAAHDARNKRLEAASDVWSRARKGAQS